MNRDARIGSIALHMRFATCFRTLLFPALAVAGSISSIYAAEMAKATISSTQLTSNTWKYDLVLDDIGTTNLGTFWFGWVPGENFMPAVPTHITSPASWMANITGGGGFGQGYAIQWVAGTGAGLAAGGSLTGFSFESTASPAAMAGISPAFGVAILTSFVYAGNPFSDGGFEFIVSEAPTTPPVITTKTLPNGTVGKLYSEDVLVSGGTPPYGNWTVTAGALPSLLTLNPATGQISGTPASASLSPYNAPFRFTVTAQDSVGQTTAPQPLSIFVFRSGEPSLVSLSPAVGAGTSVTFRMVVADPYGWADLADLGLLMNTSVTGGHGCYVDYRPSTLLRLAGDTGLFSGQGVHPGSLAGDLSNSQCTVSASHSSVSMAGNNLTLTVALTFSGTFAASRNLYVYVADISGHSPGWTKEGTWTPNPDAGPPAIVSIAPNAGLGTPVTFKAVYSDPNGAGDLSEALLLMNTSLGGADACYVNYQVHANRLYLSNNAGNGWVTPSLTPGEAGAASNGQCTLNAGSSSVAAAGNNLTLDLALSFTGTFVGAKNVYLYAAGYSGQNSGWIREGEWTPKASAGPPSVVSLSPKSGGGTSVTLHAVYSDPNGAADLNEILLQINTSQSGAHACYLYYQPQGNHLYLANDAGVWIVPALTPGLAGTVSSSQCTLNAASSSVTSSGNDVTLNVALSFSGTFAGPRNVYLYDAGYSGQNSGWVKEGAWTP